MQTDHGGIRKPGRLLPELHPYCLAPGASEQIGLIQVALIVLAVESIYQLDEGFFPVTDELGPVGRFVGFLVSVAAYCALHGRPPPIPVMI